ncbi:uncharacterized protein N7459_009845 [Penicillium hispanicum]|uniref:uncharacterized protein n=1 Tax=Penicillium hispanicum TaxID=1080232 RepID=UPI0025415A9A|nr:uncharacterized protein N7459_009845 [Penicillium hispanicum]KAJ5570415.1 hypothetical protein N7459_009845 [Penicillium hispanicum]
MSSAGGNNVTDIRSLKRFYCRQCDKRYTKLEHLTCGRSFGRQDVLGRHMRLHRTSNLSSYPNPGPESETLHAEHTGHTEPAAPPISAATASHFRQPDPLAQPNIAETNHSLDSDNLLEWLMSDANGYSVAPLPLTGLSGSLDATNVFGHPVEYPLSGELDTTAAHGPGNTALSQTYKLVDDLSKKLNSDVHRSGFTSGFLDACLHEFFERVSPSFPVVHEQTFSAQQSIPPLLLNMVALGSLFVCEDGATEKGEMLWRLGHTAVATSWQTLIEISGPGDSCDGVQLVLSALFGQTYALLSGDASIRTTASVFHGLGFYWARTTGMYTVRDVLADGLPTLDMPGGEKTSIWRSWAASEVQRRAVLAHYVLDGLISQASGSPASARHLINNIGLASSDAAFEAKTADDWIKEITRSRPTQLPISAIFARIFSPDYTADPLHLSRFSIFVLIEGLQSLIADLHEARGPVLGTISKPKIVQALLNISEGNIMALSAPSDVHHRQLLIRWHCIFIEVTAPSVSVYRWLCRHYQLPQALGGIHAKGGLEHIDLNRWARHADALRAALHAIAITRLLHDLPLSQAHTMHIPTAVFTSAVVMVTICLLNENVIKIPERYTWSEVWSVPSIEDPMQELSNSGSGLEALARELGHGSEDTVVPINLLDELNSLQIILRTVASRWGVSAQMENVIGHLAMLARERISPVL